LADYYFQQKDFAKVVELFAHQEVTSKTEDGTILAVADSLDRTGRSSKAAELLETALKVKPPTGPLYLALATYYQHSGKPDRAETFQNKGRALLNDTGGKAEEQ
jgi:predicted Zn-dependent protease